MHYTAFQTVQGLLGDMSLSEGKPAQRMLTGKTMAHKQTPLTHQREKYQWRERERENLTKPLNNITDQNKIAFLIKEKQSFLIFFACLRFVAM